MSDTPGNNSPCRLSNWVCLTALSVAFLAFCYLAISAAHIEYFEWDLKLTHWLQANSSPEILRLMVWVSKPANGWNPWLLVTVVGVLLWRMQLGLAGLVTVSGVAFGGFINRVLKSQIARPRPDDSLVQVFTEYAHESFPSGHVVFFVQFFGFLAVLTVLYQKRHWACYLLNSSLIALIILVGVSRVYLGAHWPSDVIGGYLVGSLWLALMVWFYRKRKSKQGS